MSQWQPIETAPKDGTQVLLRGGMICEYEDDPKANGVRVGWYSGDREETPWRYCSFDHGYYGCFSTEPEEWMPIPEGN